MPGWGEVTSEQSLVAQRPHGALGKQAYEQSEGARATPELGSDKNFRAVKEICGSEVLLRLRITAEGSQQINEAHFDWKHHLCSLNTWSVSSQALWMH